MLQARQLEQGSLAWHEARALRLTASDLPLALGHFGGAAELVSKKSQLLTAICQGTTTDISAAAHQPALVWGRTHEAQAATAYEMLRRAVGRPVTLHVAGLWILPDANILAASPDRVFSDSNGLLRVLEIKCPYSRQLPPSLPEHVRLQVIMQLACAPLPVSGADVLFWTPSKASVFHVEWSTAVQQEWHEIIKPKAVMCYVRHLQQPLQSILELHPGSHALLEMAANQCALPHAAAAATEAQMSQPADTTSAVRPEQPPQSLIIPELGVGIRVYNLARPDYGQGTIVAQDDDKWKVHWSGKDLPSHKGIAAKQLQAVIVKDPEPPQSDGQLASKLQISADEHGLQATDRQAGKQANRQLSRMPTDRICAKPLLPGRTNNVGQKAKAKAAMRQQAVTIAISEDAQAPHEFPTVKESGRPRSKKRGFQTQDGTAVRAGKRSYPSREPRAKPKGPLAGQPGTDKENAAQN